MHLKANTLHFFYAKNLKIVKYQENSYSEITTWKVHVISPNMKNPWRYEPEEVFNNPSML